MKQRVRGTSDWTTIPLLQTKIRWRDVSEILPVDEDEGGNVLGESSMVNIHLNVNGANAVADTSGILTAGMDKLNLRAVLFLVVEK